MGFALKKGALVDEGDLPAEEENDDEEERKQRRKSKAPHSDGAKTPAAKKSKIRPTGDAQDDPSSRPLASAGSSKLGGSNPQMSNEQLSALYAKCMELCTGDVRFFSAFFTAQNWFEQSPLRQFLIRIFRRCYFNALF
jgi:hypothetical protein